MSTTPSLKISTHSMHLIHTLRYSVPKSWTSLSKTETFLLPSSVMKCLYTLIQNYTCGSQ